MQRAEFIAIFKKLRENYPNLKHFKRGESYLLPDGSSHVLPNSAFILDDGRVLVSSTTSVSRVQKDPGIFAECGYRGKGTYSRKVKQGLLFSADFENCENVIIKKQDERVSPEKVQREAKINKEFYGLGEPVFYESSSMKKPCSLIIMRDIPGKNTENLFYEMDVDGNLRGKGIEFLPYFIAMLEELERFHAKGWVHLDSGARNFNYDEEKNKFHLLDFGFAHPAAELKELQDKEFFIPSGIHVPEFDNKCLASDIFCMGKELCYLVNIIWEDLYEDHNTILLRKNPPNPKTPLEQLIYLMLQKDPKERPTLPQIIKVLRKIHREKTITKKELADALKLYNPSSFFGIVKKVTSKEPYSDIVKKLQALHLQKEIISEKDINQVLQGDEHREKLFSRKQAANSTGTDQVVDQLGKLFHPSRKAC